MRPDFSKVIVERPRLGRGVPRRGKRRKQAYKTGPESAPLREPIDRFGTKALNENLAPMRRFLRRRVGCRWNDVYSEICAHIRLSSAVQKHVRDHLDDMVASRVTLRDGQLFGYSRYGGPEGFAVGRSRWRTFYVCPTSGRLCEIPLTRRGAPSSARGCSCAMCRAPGR